MSDAVIAAHSSGATELTFAIVGLDTLKPDVVYTFESDEAGDGPPSLIVHGVIPSFDFFW